MHKAVLWVACVTQVLVVLDTSVMNVALPSARADLGLNEVGTSWVALAYTVGFAGTLLAGARLADAFGCERVLAWSVIVFTLASGGGGLAPDGEVLIAARAVQGVCAAVASPATFTLLTVAFPEGPSRIRAVAIWTGASLAGGGAGNVLSGLLTEYVSWRAVLLINLPIGIAIAVGAFALDRKHDTAPRGHVDLPGTVLVTGVFTAAAVAVSSLEPGGYLMIGTAAGSVALVLLCSCCSANNAGPGFLWCRGGCGAIARSWQAMERRCWPEPASKSRSGTSSASRYNAITLTRQP